MRVTPTIDENAFVEQSSSASKILFLLQYAHLAPSTHNVQPWLFKPEDSSVKIYYNPKLILPEGDVLGRDLYISLGCCIENLITAARYFGVYDDVRYFDEEDNLVAEVSFKNLDKSSTDSKEKPLLDAIIKRFNARGLFKKTPVSAAVLAKLKHAGKEYGKEVQLHLVTDKTMIKRLAELTAEGLRSAYRRPAFRREISGWIRNNLSSKRDGIPGYSLRMPTPLSIVMPWMMRNFNIGGKLARLNYMSLNSAPLICVFTADKNNSLNYINVGRLAERVMLEANAAGMKTSIFVASIEIDALHKEVQGLLRTDRIPQFLMCVGYIDTPQGHTPRQPLESRII